ncbi:MAG: Hsp20/alpha crystallin family protein [Anaerolineales bacterium]|jgi:HSP20 family protein|nr:Hsp20/alpha crystallin family protein [Anaerolineales bacterium]
MPTIVRKTQPLIVETRREIYNSIVWHVRSNTWRPPTDMYETEDNVIVKMEIAGMRDEDLEVALQDNQLSISGTRADSTERKAYHQMEIPFGKFSVGIELPVRVNTESATAEYKDGFLTIQLPKEK